MWGIVTEVASPEMTSPEVTGSCITGGREPAPEMKGRYFPSLFPRIFRAFFSPELL
jgi:hypothetical protein